MDDSAARDPIASVSVAEGVVADTPPKGYYDRKEQGWCTYGQCPLRALDGYQFCAGHRKRRNKRKARQQAQLRDELAAAGKCIRCRKPSATYRCPACRLLDQCSLPKMSVAQGEVTTRAARIASRTITHADGRTRYHGQSRRGQQTHDQLNKQDGEYANAALERGMRGLAQYAAAMSLVKARDPAAMPRIQREDLKSAALHEIELAYAHLRDIMDRYGHVPADRGGEEDEA